MNDECCPPLFGGGLGPGKAADLAATLKAIADPNRLRMLNLIDTAGEVCACELTEPLGLSQPTVSHHLKVLTEAGFLARRQRGRWAYYRLINARVAELTSALAVSASV